MNETTLLEYGLRELPAFRADKSDLMAFIGNDLGERHSARERAVGQAIRDVLRSADERREAAGLTRDQAERACVLAARAEGKAR